MNTQDLDRTLSYLQQLLAISSPTGCTEAASDYLMKALSDLGYSPVKTRKGAVQVRLGGEGTEGLMLAAHVDTLGGMVRSVKSNGRLRVSPIGGLAAVSAVTETVVLYTRDGREFDGTLQLEDASVHVNGKLRETIPSWDNLELVLDEEVHNAEETKALGIGTGDFVFVNPRTQITKSGYIKSRFLDDKLSAAILLGFAAHLKENGLVPQQPLYLNFTTYEEVGHGGAANLPADLAEFISVDMGCVGEDLNCDETKVSICVMDSNGPSSRQTVDALVEAAKRCHADYVLDIYPHYGSDADAALRSGAPVRHCVMGAGVYASHGYERSHVKGVQATFDLLLEYVPFV